jgi:hypothetical protein
MRILENIAIELVPFALALPALLFAVWIGNSKDPDE